MSNCSLVLKSKILTSGCKRYYQYLYNLKKISVRQNWLILDGEHKNNNFVIAKDSHAAEKLLISKSSIANYKKTLKALGLISILPKFTTRTNICKNNHFCQLMVLVDKPRKFISKLLTYRADLKSLKATFGIISRISRKIKSISNIHTKIKKIISNIKNSYSYDKNLSHNDPKYTDVTNILTSCNIKFKKSELEQYYSLYIESPDKFLNVAKYYKGKILIRPLKYFIKVFNNYIPNFNMQHIKKIKTSFCNFDQREYDFDELERLLIENYYD